MNDIKCELKNTFYSFKAFALRNRIFQSQITMAEKRKQGVCSNYTLFLLAFSLDSAQVKNKIVLVHILGIIFVLVYHNNNLKITNHYKYNIRAIILIAAFF